MSANGNPSPSSLSSSTTPLLTLDLPRSNAKISQTGSLPASQVPPASLAAPTGGKRKAATEEKGTAPKKQKTTGSLPPMTEEDRERASFLDLLGQNYGGVSTFEQRYYDMQLLYWYRWDHPRGIAFGGPRWEGRCPEARLVIPGTFPALTDSNWAPIVPTAASIKRQREYEASGRQHAAFEIEHDAFEQRQFAEADRQRILEQTNRRRQQQDEERVRVEIEQQKRERLRIENTLLMANQAAEALKQSVFDDATKLANEIIESIPQAQMTCFQIKKYAGIFENRSTASVTSHDISESYLNAWQIENLVEKVVDGVSSDKTNGDDAAPFEPFQDNAHGEDDSNAANDHGNSNDFHEFNGSSDPDNELMDLLSTYNNATPFPPTYRGNAVNLTYFTPGAVIPLSDAQINRAHDWLSSRGIEIPSTYTAYFGVSSSSGSSSSSAQETQDSTPEAQALNFPTPSVPTLEIPTPKTSTAAVPQPQPQPQPQPRTRPVYNHNWLREQMAEEAKLKIDMMFQCVRHIREHPKRSSIDGQVAETLKSTQGILADIDWVRDREFALGFYLRNVGVKEDMDSHLAKMKACMTYVESSFQDDSLSKEVAAALDDFEVELTWLKTSFYSVCNCYTCASGIYVH